MYTYPTLWHLQKMPLPELLLMASLTEAYAQKKLHKSRATLHRYRRKTPPAVRDQLIALSGWLEIHGKAWRGWRVTDEALYADNGMRVSPGEIRALPWLWAIRAELLRKHRHRRVRPMTQAQLGCIDQDLMRQQVCDRRERLATGDLFKIDLIVTLSTPWLTPVANRSASVRSSPKENHL